MALLIAAPWPGNVRQLLNLLEQAIALTTNRGDSRIRRAERAARGRFGAGPLREARARSSGTIWCAC